MGFDVGLQDQTDPEYEIADNVAVNLVDAIRSDMVGNEEAFLLANAAYATGLSPRTETYNAIQIQGSSGAGKSDLKQRVDELWPNGWLLRLSDTSEKGLIDDQRWNDVYVFAGDEQNKLPSSAIEILKSCVTGDHDVVTTDGLVNIKDVSVGDTVLSWNEDTGEIEHKPVTDTFHYDEYDGTVTNIQNRDIDITVTDNHTVPVSIGGRGDNDFEMMDAAEANEYQQYQFPSGKNGIYGRDGVGMYEVDIAEYLDTEQYDVTDDTVRYASPSHRAVPRYYDAECFATLCAWYITEGGSYKQPEIRAGSDYVSITQAVDSDHTDSITGAIDGCGLDHSTYVNNRDERKDVAQYRISNTVIYDVMTELCGYNATTKKIPEFVFEHFSVVQKRAFLSTLMDGDGDSKETSYRYTTVSETLAEQCIQLGFECGITPTLKTEPTDVETHNTIYRVRFNEDWQDSHADDRTVEEADGVYCLEVADNHTFITGRNGKFSVTGNSFGDDGDEDGWGYTYTRNTSQQDDEEDTTEFKKQTLPFVTLIADENEQKGTDHELGTRNVTLRVEDNEDINEAVSEAMWGAQNVTLPDSEYEYNFVFEDGKQAIRQHIANIPRFPQSGTNAPAGWMHNQQYSYPVLIPYDDTMEWPSPQGPIKWKAHKVIKSMFSFKRTESKRASKSVRNFVRGWTILNHHNREVIEMDGHEWLVAAPQDVGNVIATRQTLLGLTHNFNEKNMAVVRALTDPDNGVGGAGPQGGVAATIQDIHEYLEEYADITSVSEPHLRTNILQEMADRFLITIHEGEGENGAHLYEYHGGSVFGHPNVAEYPEIFAKVTDPIRDQPITETIQQTKEQLNARTTDSLFESQGGLSGAMGGETDTATESTEDSTQASDGLGQYGTGTQTDTEVELTAIESLVADKLRATIDDCRVTPDDMESLDVTHMVGASPVEYYSGEDGYQYVRAERPYNDGDKTDTLLDTSHSHWGANVDMNKVQATVETAIASLRDKEVFEAYSEDDGVLYLLVNEQ